MKTRTGILIGCATASLMLLGGCGLLMIVVHYLLPAEESLPDGRALFSIAGTLEPGMSFQNVVSSFPTQFVDRTEKVTRPRYSGAILSATNATVSKALYCRGITNTREGYPLPDEAILYFDNQDRLVGLNWSSYTRNVGWRPKWGTVVNVFCDGRVEAAKKD